MDEYILQPNEAIIFDDGERIKLTNLHIVETVTTWTGLLKLVPKESYVCHPINQIKIYEGKPQVIYKEEDDIIDVYFIDGKKTFEIDGKKDCQKFVSAINELLTGEKLSFEKTSKKSIPGSKFIAERLKGTVDAFKGAFNNTPEPVEERIVAECPSCCASLSGIKGRIVSCEYCNSKHQL